MSDTTTTDPVAAEIDRRRAFLAAAAVSPESFEIPGLLTAAIGALDALEKVLALADGATPTDVLPCICKECRTCRQKGEDVPHEPDVLSWDLTPDALRRAITAALLGEGG